MISFKRATESPAQLSRYLAYRRRKLASRDQRAAYSAAIAEVERLASEAELKEAFAFTEEGGAIQL